MENRKQTRTLLSRHSRPSLIAETTWPRKSVTDDIFRYAFTLDRPVTALNTKPVGTDAELWPTVHACFTLDWHGYVRTSLALQTSRKRVLRSIPRLYRMLRPNECMGRETLSFAMVHNRSFRKRKAMSCKAAHLVESHMRRG